MHPRWKKAAMEMQFFRANKYKETSGATRAAGFLQRPKGSRSQVLAGSDGGDAAQALLSIAIMDLTEALHNWLHFSEQGRSCPFFRASAEAFFILALILGNERNKEKMEEIQRRTEIICNWHMEKFLRK